MRQIQYKNFSLRTHQKRWENNLSNVCQFELTFACPLHCQHCYSDCYNNQENLKKELSTEEIIFLLEKVYNSGVLWLCLTGGDPLAREDFFKIYSYAKKKGFIITVFTSGTLITEDIADYFKELKPFCIELTLNGVTKKTYEAISGIRDSFEKVMSAIFRLKKRKIPLKIKTEITKQNILEIGKIRDFVEGLGLKFRSNEILNARLNQDLTPCRLRITPEEVLFIRERCRNSSIDKEEILDFNDCRIQANGNLFRCAAGIDTFHIDPYGNMFLCSTIREPSVNLLKNEIADGLKLFKRITAQKFRSNSKCKTCSIWHLCYRCPGRAYLETGNHEAPIEYLCKLAHLIARNNNDSKPIVKCQPSS